MKILLVEDEKKLAQALQKGLWEHGYSAQIAFDAESARLILQGTDFSVIISDVILPGISGVEFLKEIRSQGNMTPVLLLTALGQIEDKSMGFGAGADDYLTKPFEFQELLMRIQALSRRTVKAVQEESLLRYADVEMDMRTKEVRRGGKLIPLTPKEFELLFYFLKNPQRFITKTELAEKVWDLNFDTGTNVVEVYINFLRKKIEKNFDIKLIHTQHKGYIFRDS